MQLNKKGALVILLVAVKLSVHGSATAAIAFLFLPSQVGSPLSASLLLS